MDYGAVHIDSETDGNLSGVIEPLPSISNKLNKSLISANSRLVNWSPSLMLKFPCKSLKVTIYHPFSGNFSPKLAQKPPFVYIAPFPWFKLFLNSENFYLKSQTELGGSIWRVFKVLAVNCSIDLTTVTWNANWVSIEQWRLVLFERSFVRTEGLHGLRSLSLRPKKVLITQKTWWWLLYGGN